MRLLITTQAVDLDDPILGFFHRWIEEFALHCDEVHVIALRTGSMHLPANVHVYSLSSVKATTRLTRALRFYSLIWRLRHSYDAVLVHMNPEYIVLGGLFWKVRGIKTGLWYVHKSMTAWLVVAERLVDVIFTAVANSITLKSKKIRIMGHGMDINSLRGDSPTLDGELDIRTTGRVSKSKGIDVMLDVCDELHKANTQFSMTIIGAPVTDDERRFAVAMQARAAASSYASRVHFASPVRNADIPRSLHGANMFLNLSETGGLDKSVLEAVLLGIPVISSNPTFQELLSPYNLFVESRAASTVVARMHTFRQLPTERQSAIIRALREEVERRHSLPSLVPAILLELRS